MSIKRKILLRIGLAMAIAALLIIAIVAFHIRYSTIEAAKQKATLVSEITRDALTAHMVNGIMDKKDLFLSNIAHLKGVQQLRIIRGENVIKQFGKTRDNESAQDQIDLDVLKSGKSVEVMSENFKEVRLRTTIPYIANANIGSPNCIQCHNAKEGEVLGAITMEFDLGEIKSTGIETILKIIFVSIVSLGVVILMLNRFLNPYLDLFSQLTEKIKAADNGDYSQRIETSLKDEAGDVAKWFNDFMQKLEDTFKRIEQSIGMFVSCDRNFRKLDPLEETKNVVEELSEIYKFKRTIENDASKMDVYDRITTLFSKKFGIENFTIYEVDSEKNTRMALVQYGEHNCCSLATLDNSTLCRSNRIGKDVLSDDFDGVCSQATMCGEKPYICLPISVGGRVTLVINIVAESEEKHNRIKTLLPRLHNYLGEATSVIESKKLMEMLRESSLRDAMTGLYNRRFLEEYLTKAIPQALRTNKKVGILMIDLDHFKMVNDTYGHDIGDAIIKKISKTIVDNIREADLAVRYGGEEFLVLIHDVNGENDILTVAEKLRSKVMEMKVKAGNEMLQKTVSIGVAMFPDDADGVWKCIKFADIALYKAKENGRNRVVRFTKDMWVDDGTGY
jgi:diguanylate cyclase (GGDEF)-like protein